jgi:hypothetical protein
MFGLKPVRRAIVVPLEVFVLETRLGANKITPGKMAAATPAEVAPVDRIIGSLKTVAAIQVAISASFARSPGISDQCDCKSHQGDANDNDFFLHGEPSSCQI